MDAQCLALQAEVAILQTRCARLEAENAALRGAVGVDAHGDLPRRDTPPALSDLPGLEQSLLNLSGCEAGSSSTPFSPSCRLAVPPLNLQESVVRHQGATAPDEGAHRWHSPEPQVLPSPRSSFKASEPGLAGHSRFSGLSLNHSSSAASRVNSGAFAAASQLPILTRPMLSAISADCGLALGLGLYERTALENQDDPSQFGHFKLGLPVYSNDALLHMHHRDSDTARGLVMRFVQRNIAFRRALKGLLRNVLRGDSEPVCVRSLFVHQDRPSVMFCIWLYPCSFQDGPKYNELAFFMVSVPQTCSTGLTENLLQDHIALKFAPVMVATVDADGQVVAQNSASFGAIGFHGRDHRRLGAGQTRVHYLEELFLLDKDAYHSMLTVTMQGGTFSMTVLVSSPMLLSWLGVQGTEVWHEIQVSKLAHPVYLEPLFIVSEKDVTDTIVAQRRVLQLQKLQRDLLSEILPPQVADKLLDESFSARSGASDADANRMVQQLASQRGELSTVGSTSNAPAMDYFDEDAGMRLTRRDVMSLATYHEEVTILFTDIVGFTAMSQQLHPSEVLLLLNNLYSIYDGLCDVYDVYKVETIGDSFMVAGGLLVEDKDGSRRLGGVDPNHAAKVLGFARAVVAATTFVLTPLGFPVQVRVGIHSGTCMSGVVGRKMPRFCLFGDTINSASRMESTGKAGMIHVSEATRDLLPNEPWEATGGVFAKGKGTVESFMWSGEHVASPYPSRSRRPRRNSATSVCSSGLSLAMAHSGPALSLLGSATLDPRGVLGLSRSASVMLGAEVII